MARILILANDYCTIYNFRRELIVELVNRGHDVVVGLPRDTRNSVFTLLGCELVDVKITRFGKNPLRELSSVVGITAILRRIRPDVLLTYTVKPNAYGGIAAAILEVPHIATVTGVGSAFQTPNLLGRLSAFLQRLAYRKSKMVFFQNEENRKVFQQLRILNGPSVLVPGSGVNLALNKFVEYPEEAEEIRFVTVARVRHDKGFDELIEAIRRLSDSGVECLFHIVGGFEETGYGPLLLRLQETSAVIVHGSVSQERVSEIVAQAHCLIHPSHHEGMANVVLEAAALGRPAIVSDIPGCREAVSHGLSGLLFEPRDVDDLEKRIRDFLALPRSHRQKMGVIARRKMEEEFDRQLVVDKYILEIDNVLQNRRETREE